MAILKALGIVILAILLIVFVLTLFSLRIYLDFDKRGLRVSIKYLFLTVFKLDTSEKTDSDKGFKAAYKRKPDDTDVEITEISEVSDAEAPPETENQKDEEPEEDKDAGDGDGKTDSGSLLDKWNAVKVYLPKVKKLLKKLFKLIKINDLDLSLKVGGSDAYEAAMNFAKANGVFYNALALICCLFRVKIKSTRISCDYEHKGFDCSGSMVVSARVLGLIAIVLYILINYIKIKSALDGASSVQKRGITGKKD